MRRSTKYGAILALAAVVVVVLALATGRSGGDPAEPQGPTPDAARSVATPEASGLRVVLDPETGALIQDPSDIPADEEGLPPDRLRTYSGDLIQEPLPQGGFKVDLKGRFQSSLVATVDPLTDEVHVDCVRASEGEAEEGDHEH